MPSSPAPSPKKTSKHPNLSYQVNLQIKPKPKFLHVTKWTFFRWPAFSLSFLFPLILGEIHRKQKFCQVITWDTNLIGGGCSQYPSVATWVALTLAYPGHSPTQNEPFKEVKKSFLPSYLYMENSIKERVKIWLFLKKRPSIYNMFVPGRFQNARITPSCHIKKKVFWMNVPSIQGLEVLMHGLRSPIGYKVQRWGVTNLVCYMMVLLGIACPEEP